MNVVFGSIRTMVGRSRVGDVFSRRHIDDVPMWKSEASCGLREAFALAHCTCHRLLSARRVVTAIGEKEGRV